VLCSLLACFGTVSGMLLQVTIAFDQIYADGAWSNHALFQLSTSGVTCVVLSHFVYLQKWSHMKNEKLPEGERKPMWKRPLWW